MILCVQSQTIDKVKKSMNAYFHHPHFWIMTWGSKAEVLEPGSLRQEIRAEAEKMASRYGATHCG